MDWALWCMLTGLIGIVCFFSGQFYASLRFDHYVDDMTAGALMFDDEEDMPYLKMSKPQESLQDGDVIIVKVFREKN